MWWDYSALDQTKVCGDVSNFFFFVLLCVDAQMNGVRVPSKEGFSRFQGFCQLQLFDKLFDFRSEFLIVPFTFPDCDEIVPGVFDGSVALQCFFRRSVACSCHHVSDVWRLVLGSKFGNHDRNIH